MSTENKFARIMRDSGPARFFIPIGIVLIIFGIILLGIKTDNYVEATGKITSVTELPRTGEDSEQSYEVKFTFEADGKTYENSFELSGGVKVGDDIKLFYDPEDPTKVTNTKNNALIGTIMIIAGAVALVFGAWKTVQAFKKSKELDAAVPGGGSFPTAEFEGFKTAPGVTEYYVRFDGHGLKPGYIVEDAGRTVLFEGKMTKQALVGPRTFEFVNHVSGKSETHEVGHTVTQSYGDELFSAKSWFKFDGRNVWDVLHEKGVRLSTNLHSKFPYSIYDAAKDGVPFARFETSGIYVHEEDEAQHSVNIPTGYMYYRVWTASKDFDLLFLTVFAVSETDQAVVE